MRLLRLSLALFACTVLTAHAELDLRLPADAQRDAATPVQPAPAPFKLEVKASGCTSGVLGCSVKSAAVLYGALHDDRAWRWAKCAPLNAPDSCRNGALAPEHYISMSDEISTPGEAAGR